MNRLFSRKIDFLWLFDRERLMMAATMEVFPLMVMMDTRWDGLDPHEVTDRRRTYGENTISLPLGRRHCSIAFMSGRELEDFLGKLSNRFVSVVRKGMEPFIELQGSRLVPGDIVFLVDGELIPADIRLIEAEDLKVDQHLLTGSNIPVEKTPFLSPRTSAVVSVTSLPDICLAGTAIVSGKARGVVISTGPATYLGKIIYGY